MPTRVIAIDGPSASGKSTVARRLAAVLGYLYVDSGSLYRGITWQVLRTGRNPSDRAAVLLTLHSLRIEFLVEAGAVRFKIDGIEPGVELRSEAVSACVSAVAALPEVRAQVTTWLQGLRSLGDLVMEGRDIGTVVFPDADVKVYLDATLEERARRRHAELGAPADVEALRGTMAALERRDRQDSAREAAPLRVAPDARVLDTTGLTIEQVVERLRQWLAESQGACPLGG